MCRIARVLRLLRHLRRVEDLLRAGELGVDVLGGIAVLSLPKFKYKFVLVCIVSGV